MDAAELLLILVLPSTCLSLSLDSPRHCFFLPCSYYYLLLIRHPSFLVVGCRLLVVDCRFLVVGCWILLLLLLCVAVFCCAVVVAVVVAVVLSLSLVLFVVDGGVCY